MCRCSAGTSDFHCLMAVVSVLRAD
jgi:hypothetical protein